jgi:hypothetical protein
MILWTPEQGIKVLYDESAMRRIVGRQRRDVASQPAQTEEAGVTKILSDDGFVQQVTRQPDGTVVVRDERGTTTTYPDGRREFQPRQFLQMTAQPPNPPLSPEDQELLVRWREVTADQLLEIVKALARNDKAIESLKERELSRGLTPYQQINLRATVIYGLLPK